MTLSELNPFSKKNVPVRYERDEPFTMLRYDMDTMFNDFFRGSDIEPMWSGHISAFSPNIDIKESDKEIEVTAELPGIDEKDIDLSLNKDSLIIKGEKKEEKEDKGGDFYRMERSYGSFSRTIPLPVEVKTGKVSATYKKGILKIKLPKNAKAIEGKKKITIKTD